MLPPLPATSRLLQAAAMQAPLAAAAALMLPLAAIQLLAVTVAAAQQLPASAAAAGKGEGGTSTVCGLRHPSARPLGFVECLLEGRTPRVRVLPPLLRAQALLPLPLPLPLLLPVLPLLLPKPVVLLQQVRALQQGACIQVLQIWLENGFRLQVW